MPTQRLQKIIAQAGISSRRAAEKLIVQGRVRVNGVLVRSLGSQAAATDRVEVAGMGVLAPERKAYVMLYKPPYVVSTVADPEGRTTVLQLLQQSAACAPCAFEADMPRLYPVGRLDFDAEGLILLTNDGAMAQHLLHPKQHVPRTYRLKVRGCPEPRALLRLRQGLRLRRDDGSWTTPTAPAVVQVVKKNPHNTWLDMTLFEGRNHQVKRMAEAIGHPVIRLVRIEFAGIALDPQLPAGAWRPLQSAELDMLKAWQPAAPTKSKRRASGN